MADTIVAMAEPNLTVGLVRPDLRLKPVMVTFSPARPFSGVKAATLGVTLKTADVQTVPALFVTQIWQEVAPSGTLSLIEFAVTIVIGPITLTPQNCTLVTLERFVPLRVTNVPAGPLAGERVVTVGGLITIKLVAVMLVPSAVIRVSLPGRAEDGMLTTT